MSDFWSTVDIEAFADLTMEEAGLAILRWWYANNLGKHANLNNFGRPRGGRGEACCLVFAEGWAWLQSKALIVPDLSQIGSNGWRNLSRRGIEIAKSLDEEDLDAKLSLSREHLHQALQGHAYQSFIRGDLDGAAQKAFKDLEVRVRRLGGYGDNVIGDALMAAAFNEDKGPLADSKAGISERRGMRNLFQGAYQVYRNPVAHRDGVLNSATEGAEVLMLASHLMRILDRVEARIGQAGG